MASRKKPAPVPPPDSPPFVVIPKGAKPSKAASNDPSRSTLQNGYLRRHRDGGWQLLVTDSYGLACIPVEVENVTHALPTEGPVPLAALKHAEKVGGLRSSNGTVEPCSRLGAGFDVLYKRSDVQGPTWDELLGDEHRPKKPFRVGLNTKILRQVAEALGSDSVELEFDPENNLSCIRVQALRNDKAVGLVMPVRLNP